MPDKAELKRQRAQLQRDKARNRQEEEEEDEEAKRRRAQSQRDKARNQREEERISRVTRATQQQLVLDCQLSLLAAVLGVFLSTISLVAIIEARLAKFMQNIAR
ncbi:hypothetical protein K505DRAFT_341918 [Melanomma pulvis-pyrius CBS 109.77]|uniref:Uncharacterized protein n=1 Tax=Melanomma pulvis-pyrius CBS 109.77 TaxID=1314802 RepID=A0A6A6WX33_9PLEO|nr:hypothetical protein K505DRAFT_341918 [Melanomma pulvis-pyrius CBS 109.77]